MITIVAICVAYGCGAFVRHFEVGPIFSSLILFLIMLGAIALESIT